MTNLNAVINIAKGKLGMAEDDYRAMLERVTGKASLKVMSDRQKTAVLDEMQRMGFSKTSGKRPPAKRADVRYCHVLWGLLHKAGVVKVGGAKGLNAFIRSRYGAAWGAVPIDIDRMTEARQISTVIEALQAWCKRNNIPTELPREGEQK
ncbi:uncharacterized protein DUF1018 [Rhodobacter aestuarii]|uniref:Mu-like prophage protein gp16 n=1 Tax=Rhodobacter aestuarii TaxID=453582 RepID=A0A1N7Q226_9RHOB|nr:regulatory protein GemA [Rhodobacter aestuarii]PTV94040.1 uncharacterized protein DUF1018 [Rhodobacter aestuarii]SIT16892.1 Protein of unknown function [Rhodobacter aestuarii]